jgi:hypothetical protein
VKTDLGRCLPQIANFFRYSFHTNVFSGPDGIPENFGDVVTGRTSVNTRSGGLLLDRKVGHFGNQRDSALLTHMHHEGTPIHHFSKRHHARPNKLLPHMGYPAQRGERSQAQSQPVRAEPYTFISQMVASRKLTDTEHQFSSSGEAKTERVRRLGCAKPAGCILQQKS